MTCSTKFHRVLIRLDKVCKNHAKVNGRGYYQPKEEIKKQNIKKMDNEISKLLNYLKHPHYSYLHK